MGWRDDLSNFNMSRLTILGWVIFLLSVGAGIGAAIVVGAYWESWFPPPPLAITRRRGPSGIVGVVGAVVIFFLAKVSLALIGVRIVRPKEDLSGLTNDQVFIELHRQVSRARGLHLLFMLLMPLGFLVPCGLAVGLASAQDSDAPEGITPSQILGMIALTLPIIGVVGWLLMLSDLKKKSEALAQAEDVKIQAH